MWFRWHYALWALLALPVIAGTYVALLRREHDAGVRYTRMALVRTAMAGPINVRPHLPALAMLAGIALLFLASARPVVVVSGPSSQGTIVLLMDVSLSMAASDVPPTRLEAARAAAKNFVQAQPRDVRMGVVAFGGYASIVQRPTSDRDEVLAALDRLELQRYTALGTGLLGALLTIVPDADVPPGYDIFGTGGAPIEPETANLAGGRLERWKPAKRASSTDRSAAIILVSDGRGTMGVPAADAAKAIASFGIRVYTVGVGTLYGGTATVEGWPSIHAEFDDESLKQIADITGGEYYLARDGAKVARIYEKLGRRVVLQKSEREITSVFTAIALMLIVVSGALSLLWTYRSA
jgi:Ca-activated chloride channel family protein